MPRIITINPAQCRKTPEEAVLWLLQKAPHSEEEIAEHFGLPLENVAKITRSLLKGGMISRFRKNKKILYKALDLEMAVNFKI